MNPSFYHEIIVIRDHPKVSLRVHQNVLALGKAFTHQDQIAIVVFAGLVGWPVDAVYVVLHAGHAHGKPVRYIRVGCYKEAVSLDQIRSKTAYAAVDRQRVLQQSSIVVRSTDKMDAGVIMAVTAAQPAAQTIPPTQQPSVSSFTQSSPRLRLHRRVNSGSAILAMVLLFSIVIGLITWTMYDLSRKPATATHRTSAATIVATKQVVSTSTPTPSVQLKTTGVPAKLLPYSGHWIVAENQSLSAIADALGTVQNYDDIAKVNGILNPNIINVGEDLVVILGYRQVLKGVPGRSYVVVNGDNVWVTSAMVITGTLPATPIYHRPDYESQAMQLRGDITHTVNIGYRVYAIDGVVTAKQHECALKGVTVVTAENAADMLKRCGAG